MLRAYRPSLVTAPAASPVSLEAAKEHCRVLHDDEDGLLQAYLDAAVNHLDAAGGILGRCLINQTWQQKWSGFPPGEILPLPFPDVSSVTVTYTANGSDTTFAASNYALLELDWTAAVVLKSTASWPDVDDIPAPVTVQFTAGFGATEDDVPAAIRHAVLLLVSTWFENRENVVVGQPVSAPLPFAVNALIAPFRRVGI